MKYLRSVATALAMLGWAGLAQGAGLHFARGSVDLTRTNEIATAKPYYNDGDDLILTLKGDALRLASKGLEARLFPIGDADAPSDGWGPYDVDCRVFVTVVIRPVRVSTSGIVDLGHMPRLYFVTASPDGSVSNGRWRLVLERPNTYSDPLLRLRQDIIKRYFEYSIYFEVKPIGNYSTEEVKQRAARSGRDASAIERRAGKVGPDVPCYGDVTVLAQERSLRLARCTTGAVSALIYQDGETALEPTLSFGDAAY